MKPQLAEQSETPPSIQDVEIVGSTDWFLERVIEIFVSNGVDLGVTLTVGGTIISGMLVSGKKYFQELAETIGEDDEIRNLLSQLCRKQTSLYEKPEGAPDDWQAPPIGYLHLRDARYFSPGQSPIPTKGTLWRGKLSSVDGFTIGNFAAFEPTGNGRWG